MIIKADEVKGNASLSFVAFPVAKDYVSSCKAPHTAIFTIDSSGS